LNSNLVAWSVGLDAIQDPVTALIIGVLLAFVFLISDIILAKYHSKE